MYPVHPLAGEIYGSDPRKSGFQELGTPAAGVTKPDISGGPRMARLRETKPGSVFQVDLIVYRGRPASIDTTITATAHGSASTDIAVDSQDWNTLAFVLFGSSVRDAAYERDRLHEIVAELARK